MVELGAGDFVPADGVVLEAEGAQTNESLLTGEAYPVDKRAGECAAPVPAEAFNALFSGTVLVRGTALMLVTATGSRTRFGAIAAALESSPPPASLERGLHAFSVLIVRLVGFLVLFVLLAQLAAARPVIESFLFAVALAVGMTPELLPMIMTVTLSRGAVRMAARKVVVKRLAAIHDLGAMNVLCTDKTGTLTLGSHRAHRPPRRRRRRQPPRAANSPPSTAASRAACAARSTRRFWPARTICRSANGAALAEVPFDYERRRVSVLAEHAGQRLLIVKGAPEDVIALSTAVEQADGAVHPLDAAGRARLDKVLLGKTAQGLRCIGVGWREFAGERRPSGHRGRSATDVRRFLRVRRSAQGIGCRGDQAAGERPASASRSSPATPRRPCSIWSRRSACRRADCSPAPKSRN